MLHEPGARKARLNHLVVTEQEIDQAERKVGGMATTTFGPEPPSPDSHLGAVEEA